MATRTIPLLVDIATTLNASGAGEVSLKPPQYNQTWKVSLAAVSVSSAVLEPECRLYQDGRFIGGTYSGSLDSTDLNVTLQSNQSIKAVWTGGDTGATATLTLQGEQIIEGG